MRNVSPSQIGKTPRILFSRTDALGDLILCTPTFRALREAFPEAHIALLCRSYAAPALDGNPAIDNVIAIESETGVDREKLSRRLAAGDYDIAVALYPSSFAADVLRRARIPIRIGSSRRFHSWKFTHRISHSRKANTKSEAACNLDLLAPLGIAPGSIVPEVFVTPREVDQMKKRLRNSAVDSSFVALHPGSGGSAQNWPLEKFTELADKLHQSGMQIVYTGNDAEAALIAEANEKNKIVSLAGKTTLRELAALLSLADVVVANSTGPLHLAAAVGTDTIGLFPRRKSMSPARWAPPVENTTVVMPESSSGGMGAIPIETVLRKVYERLKVLQAN